MIVCALITEPLVSGSILGFSLGFNALVSPKAGKVLSYVFLACVIAAMRKIGHKVCDEMEAE
jgi:biotin transporter BioY